RRVSARVEGGSSVPDDLGLYLRALPEELPLQCVIFMQAGATSLAMMERGEALATKSFKRYVTRGNGKSQATFLKQKGKSRYGARLRLQNARRMLEETEERLLRLWDEHGEPDQVLVSAPKRLWAEFAGAAMRLPFDPAQVRRIGVDVDVPTTGVLLRVCKGLEYGRVGWDLTT
ncbi:MAG: hypothetical protein AAGG01_08430, partial [Planctomycetota bacterium]